MPNVDQRDWDKVRADYVSGTKSLRKLSDEYGIPYRRSYEHSRTEGWVEQRKQYREAASAKSVDMAIERRAQALANIMSASDQMAERLLEESVPGAISGARDLADAAKALKYVADTLAQVYGLQTPAQKHRQRMDEERLELDKRRLAMEEESRKQAGTTPTVRFVIEAPDGTGDLDG